jgi:AraC-like DNA-binding protein
MDIVLPDIVAAGIYSSQLVQKNVSVSKNRKTTMFEIELPTECGGISYIDSESMPIKPNLLICAKPGQTRHTKFPFKCSYVHMIVREGVLYDTLINIPPFMQTDRRKKYNNIFEKICKYSNTSPEYDRLMLGSLILELIYELKEESKYLPYRYKTKNNNYKAVENTVKYIKENLSSPLSLEIIADYAGFSPVYFHNLFKSAVGKTLHEYIEEQRIKKASDLLITTDSTLTEIAYQCGFSSQSYFSYAFKRKMRMTPREYMKDVYNRYDTAPAEFKNQ